MRAGAKAVRLERNTKYTALSPVVDRRRFIPSGTGARGQRRGRHRLQAGDCASVYLDSPGLAWRRVEVEMLTGGWRGPARGEGGAVRRRGDDAGGLTVGDELEVETAHFVEMWAAEEEAGEG